MKHYLDKASHLLLDVVYKASENCNDRPEPDDISLVVIHGISLPPGEFGGPYITQLFTNRLDSATHPFFEEISHLRVSSHLLIRRNGEVVQYVPFDRRAWHAGESQYQGREDCNNFSIGIELEGTDEIPYTDQQYDALVAVLQCLIKNYPLLSEKTITGHSDIAPGRKTDPGPVFDWDRVKRLLAG